MNVKPLDTKLKISSQQRCGEKVYCRLLQSVAKVIEPLTVNFEGEPDKEEVKNFSKLLSPWDLVIFSKMCGSSMCDKANHLS